MSTHRLLTSASLRGAAPAAAAPTAPAAPLVTTPAAAPAASTAPAEDTVDVVSLADAQAAVETARGEGAAAERTRTSAVLGSDAGKGNPTLAAFMLNANPTASSDSIIAHLGSMPAAPAATAPAAAAPTPPAPPAITTPLAQTPLVTVDTAPNDGGNGEMSAADQDKFWATAQSGVTVMAGNAFGADLAPGIPRTGN